MFSAAFTLITTLLLLGANALPTGNQTSVSPRAPTAEAVYLVNCVSLNHQSSELVYCDQAGTCQGHKPPYYNKCIMSQNYLFHWEGSPEGCTFRPSNTKFTWNIAADAQSRPVNAEVGTANNGYHDFLCFKSDGQALYLGDPTAPVNTCTPIYFCLDVN